MDIEKKMCLHLACGTVFLESNNTENWINIDIELPESHLAISRPDLVEENITDFEHYYKQEVKRDTFLSGNLHHKEIVCDMFADIRDLPFDPESIDEILAVQVFEHFTYAEGKEVLEHWTSLLKVGGILHLDVPDLDGSIALYKDDPVWATRLLYGSQKNEYGVHKGMYTRKTLGDLLYQFGYKDVEFLENMHTYPAFGIRGVKA